MPTTIPVTLGSLIEEALDSLYRAVERPRRVSVGSVALESVSDTELTLTGGVAEVTDLLEGGGELMQVTGKTPDNPPVYTVARGYAETEREVHGTGRVLLVNPPWPRSTVARWIRRAVSGLLNTELPYTETLELSPEPGGGMVLLPADTVEVLAVRHFSGPDLGGRISWVGGWQFEDDVPASPTRKALRVPSLVSPDDTLWVTVRLPYRWVGDGEAAEVQLPVAGQDIPVLWAVAYGLARREVSRAELDKIEEWNQEQAIRAGMNLRLVRDLWGEVYRRVDEARRVHRVPKHRPYRKVSKRW